MHHLRLLLSVRLTSLVSIVWCFVKPICLKVFCGFLWFWETIFISYYIVPDGFSLKYVRAEVMLMHLHYIVTLGYRKIKNALFFFFLGNIDLAATTFADTVCQGMYQSILIGNKAM